MTPDRFTPHRRPISVDALEDAIHADFSVDYCATLFGASFNILASFAAQVYERLTENCEDPSMALAFAQAAERREAQERAALN